MPSTSLKWSAVLCGFAISVLATSARAADPLPRDIEDYVVLGIDKVDFGDRTFVGDGHVGVNGGNGRLELARFVSFGDNTAAVADRVEVAKGTSFFDLFAVDLLSEPPVVFRGTTALASLPILLIDPLPAFSPGSDNLRIPQEETVDLAEGAYGNVTVSRRGTLRLTGGHYEMRSLRTGKLSKVFVQAPSVINVEGRLTIGHLAGFGPGVSNLSAHEVEVNVGGSFVRFGPATHVAAAVSAPDARVRMGRSFHGVGRFVGREVIGDQTMNFRLGEVVPGIGSSQTRGARPVGGPEFCTYTQEAFGDGGNAVNGVGGDITDHPELFPVTIGAPGIMSLTVDAQAGLVCFLPASGVTAALCEGLDGCAGDVTADACTNPPLLDFDSSGDGSSHGQGAGELAGQVLAGKLNVGLSDLGVTPGGLADFVVPEVLCTDSAIHPNCQTGIHLDPSKMEHQSTAAGISDGINTVGDLLTIADQALSNPCAGRTCASSRQAAFAPPNPTARASITEALREIFECFEGCAEVIPCPPPS